MNLKFLRENLQQVCQKTQQPVSTSHKYCVVLDPSLIRKARIQNLRTVSRR
jgi:hypothetical protein